MSEPVSLKNVASSPRSLFLKDAVRIDPSKPSKFYVLSEDVSYLLYYCSKNKMEVTK